MHAYIHVYLYIHTHACIHDTSLLCPGKFVAQLGARFKAQITLKYQRSGCCAALGCSLQALLGLSSPDVAFFGQVAVGESSSTGNLPPQKAELRQPRKDRACHFGCVKGVSKSVQVPFKWYRSLMELTSLTSLCRVHVF